MPTKKVLLWDCLCLVLAFISFHVTDDLASGSSNYSHTTGTAFWPTETLSFGLGLQPGCTEDSRGCKSPMSPKPGWLLAHACAGFVWWFSQMRGVGAPGCLGCVSKGWCLCSPCCFSEAAYRLQDHLIWTSIVQLLYCRWTPGDLCQPLPHSPPCL